MILNCYTIIVYITIIKLTIEQKSYFTQWKNTTHEQYFYRLTEYSKIFSENVLKIWSIQISDSNRNGLVSSDWSKTFMVIARIIINFTDL